MNTLLSSPSSTSGARRQPSNSAVFEVAATDWDASFAPEVQREAVSALEDGRVVFFPELAFKLSDDELRFLDPALVGDSKSVGYNLATRKVSHCTCSEADQARVGAMIQRFNDLAQTLIENLSPTYKSKMSPGSPSLRPVEAEGRVQAWQKDDTRLHVDAFPATPLNGKRILRIFSNVNPAGQPRCWRMGESFAQVSQRFLKGIKRPAPGSLLWLKLTGKTKTRRSLYDHYMLALHDAMKSDDEYQRTCPQSDFDFPAQSTWITFADSVPHAVTKGQHQFVQTFYLEVEGMAQPEKSPLRILERQLGRNLRN